MSTESAVHYAIDGEDRIAFVDEGWCRFAAANDGVGLNRSTILGQSLWDHVTDATTARLYRQIVSRVRQGSRARFTLRCDGPAFRQLLEMTISPVGHDSVRFEARRVSVEDREPVALLARDTLRSDDLLRSCGWCNRIDVGVDAADWVEVEEAMGRLRLFELDRMPQLTHGICEACFASMMETLTALTASSESGPEADASA